MPEYLEKEDVLELLKIKEFTLHDLIDKGKLRACYKCDVTLFDHYIDNPHNGERDFRFQGYIRPFLCSSTEMFSSEEFYVQDIQIIESFHTRMFVHHEDRKMTQVELHESGSYGISNSSPNYEYSVGIEGEKDRRGVKFRSQDCKFLKSEVEALMLKPESEVEILLKQRIIELENEVELLHQQLKNSQDELVENPMQKSNIARMIGNLILKLYSVQTEKNGLYTHGIIEWLQAAGKVSQKTAKYWISEAQKQDKRSVKK